jgi:hypothetical protein
MHRRKPLCLKPKNGRQWTSFKVVDFKPLAPQHCWFEFRQGLWILSCEEADQLAYGASAVLLGCSSVPEILQGRTSELFPHQ